MRITMAVPSGRKEITQDFPAVSEDLQSVVKVMLREGLEYKLHTVSIVVYNEYIIHLVSQYLIFLFSNYAAAGSLVYPTLIPCAAVDSVSQRKVRQMVQAA